jgi:hypothetical protein
MKKENPELKALFATAYATPEVRSAMTKGELHGLFIKPYSIDRFLARVSELTRTAVMSVIFLSANSGMEFVWKAQSLCYQ